MKLFEEIVLTQTEEDILVECFSHPTVIKYLRGLAQDAAQALAESDTSLLKTPEEVKSTVVYIQGSISTLAQLLELSKSKPVVQQ